MERKEMLRVLGELGAEVGTEFNDGEAVNGWLGWFVVGDELSVWHRAVDEDGAARPAVTKRWKLVETS